MWLMKRCIVLSLILIVTSGLVSANLALAASNNLAVLTTTGSETKPNKLTTDYLLKNAQNVCIVSSSGFVGTCSTPGTRVYFGNSNANVMDPNCASGGALPCSDQGVPSGEGHRDFIEVGYVGSNGTFIMYPGSEVDSRNPNAFSSSQAADDYAASAAPLQGKSVKDYNWDQTPAYEVPDTTTTNQMAKNESGAPVAIGEATIYDATGGCIGNCTTESTPPQHYRRLHGWH